MTDIKKISNKRLSLAERVQKALEKRPHKGNVLIHDIIKQIEKRENSKRNVNKSEMARIVNNKVVNKKDGIVRHSNVKKRNKVEFTKPFIPKNQIKSVPDWFNSIGHIDVSIIVPLYKSEKEIVKQIKSWDLNDDGLKKEIIYVDDCCPNKSHEYIVQEWESKKHQLKNGVGKIILNEKNSGYGAACNIGASYAKGEYLIFLNADIEVKNNWIQPMLDVFYKYSNVGIVGNLQLKTNTINIDSAGSQWSWEKGYFLHIGRHIYNGKMIHKSYTLDNLPNDLKEVSERDIVTGACFMIKSNLFFDIEGFDINYRIGYWEDSDLNMRIKAAGYKIYYTPHSVIYHVVGHSHAGSHPYYKQNRDRFKDYWIKTGRIDQFVTTPRPNDYPIKKPNISCVKDNIEGKVVGCVIACNEEEFLEASVDSVASIVDEWVFVIGGNEYAYKAGMCNSKGYPSDSTLDIAYNLCMKYKGIVIEPPGRLWKDKVEMRNAYVNFLKPGDWMFMVDGDEVYKEEQLWKISELMKKHEVLTIQFWLFWNNMNTLGTGSWEKYPQERVVKWREGYGYRGKNHLHVTDKNGNVAKSQVSHWQGPEKMFYHYSWVRPIEKIRQKREYYKYQSGNHNDTYVDEVFLKFRQNPELVKGKTHPMGGGSFDTFKGIHPKNVQQLINEGKLNF